MYSFSAVPMVDGRMTSSSVSVDNRSLSPHYSTSSYQDYAAEVHQRHAAEVHQHHHKRRAPSPVKERSDFASVCVNQSINHSQCLSSRATSML